MYVYRFLNEKNEIIYIGRAKSLRERINGHNHLPASCYGEVVKVEYMNLSNNDESSIYERYLINKHMPKYNVEYKNNSNFTFDLPEQEWIEFKYDFSARLKARYITINKNIKDDLIDSDLGKLVKLLFCSELDTEGYLCNRVMRRLKKQDVANILGIGVKQTERWTKKIKDLGLMKKENAYYRVSEKLLKF